MAGLGERGGGYMQTTVIEQQQNNFKNKIKFYLEKTKNKALFILYLVENKYIFKIKKEVQISFLIHFL